LGSEERQLPQFVVLYFDVVGLVVFMLNFEKRFHELDHIDGEGSSLGVFLNVLLLEHVPHVHSHRSMKVPRVSEYLFFEINISDPQVFLIAVFTLDFTVVLNPVKQWHGVPCFIQPDHEHLHHYIVTRHQFVRGTLVLTKFLKNDLLELVAVDLFVQLIDGIRVINFDFFVVSDEVFLLNFDEVSMVDGQVLVKLP
jgi:hypothetical protein